MTSSQSITSTSSLSLSQPPPGSVPLLELFHYQGDQGYSLPDRLVWVEYTCMMIYDNDAKPAGGKRTRRFRLC